MTKLSLPICLGAVLSFASLGSLVHAQNTVLWEAYNDYRPTELTHANVSDYDLRVTDDGGPLKNFATGSDLGANVVVVVEGGEPDDFGANSPVNEGSPADELFRGKVDVGVALQMKCTFWLSSLREFRVGSPNHPKS